MSPDGINPDLVLCWARALAPLGKRYVFIDRTGLPPRHIPLIGEQTYPLQQNPLISIDRAVTFGVEIDHSEGVELAIPYERLARHFLATPVLIRSGRPGHIHVLVSIVDKNELRRRLETQVKTDRVTYGTSVVGQLTAVRLPGSQKTPESPTYQLLDPVMPWGDALEALRVPLPSDHKLYTETLPSRYYKVTSSKWSALAMSCIIDLRARGFTAEQCWGLRKEPGFKKVLEKGEPWLRRSIARAEAYLTNSPNLRRRLRQLQVELLFIWPGKPETLRILLGHLDVAYRANRLTGLIKPVRPLAELVGMNYPAVMRGNRILRQRTPWRWIQREPQSQTRAYDLELPDYPARALGISAAQEQNSQLSTISFYLVGESNYGSQFVDLLRHNLFRDRRGRGRRACLGFGPLLLWFKALAGRVIIDRTELRHLQRLRDAERVSGIPIIHYDKAQKEWRSIPDVDWDAVARGLGVPDLARGQQVRHAEDRKLYQAGVSNRTRFKMEQYQRQLKRRMLRP